MHRFMGRMLHREEMLDLLMRETAALLGLRELFTYEEAPAWGFPFDDETLLHAEHEGVFDSLTLSAPIAPVPESCRHEVYEILLGYNAEWRETGGTRMALAAPGAPVVLLFD